MEDLARYREGLKEELLRVMALEQNQESAKAFREAAEQLRPDSCQTFVDWRAGQELGVTAVFKGSGSSMEALDLMLAAIPPERVIEFYGFANGLHADVFHFNPEINKVIDGHSFISFKLMRNG